MTRTTENRWLRWFAFLTAACTLVLICIGGLVTSKGVGMAVPDWPTSYGYNMFALPFSYWVGGVFYEHSHRLFGSFVGFLTIILMIWLWLKEERRWLRWLGVAAFAHVLLQGLLGGLRVLFDTHGWGAEFGVFHAALGQLFFVLVVAIALFTTRWWRRLASSRPFPEVRPAWKHVFLSVTLLLLGQLILGATMRHQHAGLAVPDFPLAYGQVWPAMDPESVARYNRERMEAVAYNSITALQIGLHMAHRIVAVVILIAITLVTLRTRRQFGGKNPLTGFSQLWFGLVLMQFFLGALTVWTNKAADIATVHVAVGALTLAVGSILTLAAFALTGTSRVGAGPVALRADGLVAHPAAAENRT